jgi:hypothetical protein
LEVSEIGFGNMTLSGGHHGPGVNPVRIGRQARPQLPRMSHRHP